MDKPLPPVATARRQSEDVDTLVERYRIRLNLKPWEEWADHMTSAAGKIAALRGTPVERGRRTGRTQFGILKAIALCEQTGARVLAIKAEPKANLDNCLYIARDSVAGLGLQLKIRVTADFPGCSRGELAVSYVDHHIHIGKACHS